MVTMGDRMDLSADTKQIGLESLCLPTTAPKGVV